MRIYLFGKINMPGVGIMVNCLKMRSPSGVEVRIDRDSTGVDYYLDGYFGMTWFRTYLWDSDTGDAHYLTEADLKYLKDYTFVELEVEDDAPEAYSVMITEINDEEYNKVKMT